MDLKTLQLVLKTACIVASVALMLKSVLKHRKGETQEALYDLAWAILLQV